MRLSLGTWLWLALLRKRLIEFLLARLAGAIGPNEGRLLRDVGFRLLGRLGRRSKRHTIFIDHRLHAV